MKQYVQIIIAAALLLGTTAVQADHHNKTNKVAAPKKASKAKPTPKKPNPTEARKKYAEAVKKIIEAVKAGKLTEKQAKEKYAALRKKMAPQRARASKAGILKRFDKNKDGKLCDNEKAAMRKAMAERKSKRSKGQKGRRPRRK